MSQPQGPKFPPHVTRVHIAHGESGGRVLEGAAPQERVGVTVRHRLVGEHIALGEQFGPLLMAALLKMGHAEQGSRCTTHTHTP